MTFRKLCITLATLALLAGFASAGVLNPDPTEIGTIEGISSTKLDTSFSPTGGTGLGMLTISDDAIIDIEADNGLFTFAGSGTSFQLTACLASDLSAGGDAHGEFVGGSYVLADTNGTTLLSGMVTEMDLVEDDDLNWLIGSAYLTVDSGSLQSAFGAQYGQVVQISYNLDPVDVQDFSSAFAGESNITIQPSDIPEPTTMALLIVGGVSALIRRR